MSTRLFIRGLPTTFTEAQFRAHFATRGDVTDAKLIPHRRIGYIGYKTPEQAQAAVKYFNKTFIRTSKIAVELAESVSGSYHMVHLLVLTAQSIDTRAPGTLSQKGRRVS
jgi:multiple RNA-binding domain-containing protein 1